MTILLKTVGASWLLLCLLVCAKFLGEDLLSPTETGLHGALSQPRVDILIVGSSHARQGYDAKLLETATGKHVFIIAYNGLDPVAMLPVVRAMLANPERRPELLIVEANCLRFSHSPGVDDPRLFFESPPHVKSELVREYVRTHHDRSAYLDLFSLLANRGNELILAWPLVHSAIDSLSYHGSYLHKSMPGLGLEVFAQLSVPITSDRPDPDQAAALREIVALAKSDHVKLLLADTPMAAPIEAQPEMAALQGEFQRLADSEKIPYLRRAAGFSNSDPSLFNDSNHLSTAGRELYTRLFAQELSSREGLSVGSE